MTRFIYLDHMANLSIISMKAYHMATPSTEVYTVMRKSYHVDSLIFYCLDGSKGGLSC